MTHRTRLSNEERGRVLPRTVSPPPELVARIRAQREFPHRSPAGDIAANAAHISALTEKRIKPRTESLEVVLSAHTQPFMDAMARASENLRGLTEAFASAFTGVFGGPRS